MIVFDTETTGLIKNSLQPLAQQPRIIEVAAIRLRPETMEEVGRITFRCNPQGMAIDPDAEKGHGISAEMLKAEPPFIANLGKLADFFLGARTLVAHNLPFDRDMLMMELERLDARCRFPWPPVHLCTVEATMGLKGYRLNLAALYEHVTGAKMSDKYRAHRAIDDVEALVEIVRALKQEDMI